MGIFSFIISIIICFIEFLFILIGLIITIPLIFILSVIVAVITGSIITLVIYGINSILPESAVDYIGDKIEKWQDIIEEKWKVK